MRVLIVEDEPKMAGLVGPHQPTGIEQDGPQAAATGAIGHRVEEYPGRAHFTAGMDGWEEVADDALNWALEHAGVARPAEATSAPTTAGS